MENNDNLISSVEDSQIDNYKKEWCEHFHREQISYEQGIKENRPKEEFVDMELASWVTSRFTTPLGGKRIEPERIRYCGVKKSDLLPVSDSECQCLKCRQKFPIEKIGQMEQRFQRMNELADMEMGYVRFVDLRFLELSQGLEPVSYYKKIEGSIKGVERKTNPRDWSILGRENSLFHDDILEIKYVKNEPSNLFCNISEEDEWLGKYKSVCKHYWGMAYLILKDIAYPELPKLVGEAKSALVIDEDGVCKCSQCHKVFSKEEQQKMNKLISYLNTPHYCTEEDFIYHKEWAEILEYYDEGYRKDNEPFQLFNLKKALDFSEGVEPVVFHCKNVLDEKCKRKIVSNLKWKDGAWRVKKGFFHKMKMNNEA